MLNLLVLAFALWTGHHIAPDPIELGDRNFKTRDLTDRELRKNKSLARVVSGARQGSLEKVTRCVAIAEYLGWNFNISNNENLKNSAFLLIPIDIQDTMRAVGVLFFERDSKWFLQSPMRMTILSDLATKLGYDTTTYYWSLDNEYSCQSSISSLVYAISKSPLFPPKK
jgi:hypothetical protein